MPTYRLASLMGYKKKSSLHGAKITHENYGLTVACKPRRTVEVYR
jgi:hypothetical protein